MVQTFGNRILGGIGAPESRAGEAFGAGVSTTLGQRRTRQAMDETAQLMQQREEEAARLKQRFGWEGEDRARTAAAYDAFGAPAAGGASGTPPRAGVNVAGLFEKSDVRTQLAPVWTNLESQYKLPAGYLERTAFIESGFNPTARNATSSAGGLFQFIDSTAKQYGLSDKFDPMASSNAAAQLAANNAMYLQRILGRPPTGAELYLAHQQGAGGAAKLLANPNALAVDIVGADAVRNNGGQMDMTAAEFADLWLSKWAGQGPQPYTDRSQRFAPAPGGVQPVVDTTGSSQRFQPMPRQPDQSQRFRPGDFAARAPVAGLRFGPDGSIILPTATEAMAARPGDFAARATAEQLALGQPVPQNYDPDLQTNILRAQAAVVAAEQLFREMPTGETAQRVAAAKAQLRELEDRLPASQAALAPLQAPVIAGRGLTALEGPEAVTLPPRPAAGVTVPPAMETPAATTPAPAEPAPVETVPVETAPVETPAPAPAPAPTGPSAAQLAFDPLAGRVPLAGVAGPTMTTMDVSRGANVNTISDDFPGIGALFTDTAALAIEQQALEASAAALVRQRELARQLRDANLMLDADSKLAAINARRGVIGYIAAGNAAVTGNFDPMAQALSEMSGQQVQIRPRGDNTFDLIVDGQVARQGLPADVMVQQYMYGVNDQYRTLVDQARAAEAERNAAWFDTQVEILKETLKQEAQGTREMALEAAKRSLDQTLGATPEFYTEKATLNGEEVIVVYDRKNPDTPMRIIGMRENPLVPGTFELVQRNLPDVR